MDFDFQANWSDMTTPPLSAARYIVTDGDVIVIATYLTESDGNNIWIFSGLTESDSKTFKVQSWMELPKPKHKKIVPTTTVNYENKTDGNQ